MRTNKFYKYTLAAIFLITIITACGKNPNKLDLSGTVNNVATGKIYLQQYINKSFVTIDSTNIISGRFKFNTETKLPEIYGLSLYGSGENPFDSYILFLDNNPIKVEFDTINEFEKTIVTGSKEHDLYLELRAQKKANVNDIIKEHPSSIAALYILYRYYSYRLSPEEINANIELLDPSLKNSDYVKVLTELANTLSKVSIGHKAPDFSATDPEGKSVKLSDYLGTRYVLIDFWASWCAPCRKENPNLVKVYEKYGAKDLEIIGVSLDNATAPWKKAIAADGLTWPQLIDENAWAGEGVKNYGVRLIPANFLIDKDGNIVAKNLKGEELEKTLANLFNH